MNSSNSPLKPETQAPLKISIKALFSCQQNKLGQNTFAVSVFVYLFLAAIFEWNFQEVKPKLGERQNKVKQWCHLLYLKCISILV